MIYVVNYFIYKKLKKNSLKAKIRRMEIEKKVLVELMKKVQKERFVEYSIPEFVYKIRMKK